MVIADIQYFQEIQNVYSAFTSLQIILTDKDGNQITRLTNHPNLFDLAADQENSKNIFGKIARNYTKINHLILYEILPKIKVIVCPIYIDGTIEFFIFSGYILENSSKQSVQSYLNRLLNNPQKADLLLSTIQECNEVELGNKIKKVIEMAVIIADRCQVQKIQADSNVQKSQQNNFIQLVADDHIGIYDLLQRFCDKHAAVDFVGYARKVSSVHFEIKEFLPLNNQLTGSAFLVGEGLLGKVAATNEGKFWNDVEWDPRIMFFRKKGFFPKSIFCFPIIHNQEITGLFFGGISKSGNFEKEIMFEGNLTSSMITLIETKMYWKEKAVYNHEKKKMLKDILHAIISFKDKKSVQDFLLEMSLDIIFTPFVAVVFLEENKAHIVSKGLTAEKMKEYKNDILDRQNNDPKMEPALQLTKWGDKVLEFPIHYHNNHYGWLCIGLINDLDENRISLLKLLANEGGAALHMVSAFNKKVITDPINLTERENEVLNLVLEGKNNREIAEILYISGHTVKNHMTNIFQKLNVNDRIEAITKIYQLGYKPHSVS